jgi:hypothetical protein
MVKVIHQPKGKSIMDNHHSSPGHEPTKYNGDGHAVPKAFRVGPNWWSPRKGVTQARHDKTMKSLVKKMIKSKKKTEKLTKAMAEQLRPYLDK